MLGVFKGDRDGLIISIAENKKEVIHMSFTEKGDVRKLLHDSKLKDAIAKAAVEDPETMDSLAGDIADKLSDELEDDPEIRQKIIQYAIASPEFKKRVVRKLVEDLS